MEESDILKVASNAASSAKRRGSVYSGDYYWHCLGEVTRFNTADGLTVKAPAEFTDTVVLGDSDELRFGESADLKIYHDGSNSHF